METTHDIKKKEVEDFKNKLIEYFKKPSFDVTLSQLMGDFKLNLKDLDYLQYCLDELVKEGKIIKSSSFDHYEYDLK